MDTNERPRQSPIAGKKIIIAGAGIAGLSFVASLKYLWRTDMGEFPELVQYEREHGEPDLTREGYSFGIRSGGKSLAMQALEKMGLMDKIAEAGVLRETDEQANHGLYLLNWSKMVEVRRPALPGLPRSPMRIARTRLRMILLEASTQKHHIQWRVACTSAVCEAGGTIRIGLSNGAEDTCDLLVVADGANSKLRACLRPKDALHFTGPVSISAIARFYGPTPRPVDKAWGIVPSGKGESLFVTPMGDGSVNWCLSFLANAPLKEYRQPMSPDLCQYILQEAKERGAAFREPFQALVDNTDTATLMKYNNMDKQPFTHDNASDRTVFIGDSNHAVTAFAGNGANMAISDGYDLAEALCKQASINLAFQEYDKRSVPRAVSTLEKSHWLITVAHSRGLQWLYHRSILLTYGRMLSVWYAVKDFCSMLLGV